MKQLNSDKLLGKIKECRFTLGELATASGMSLSSLRRKIEGKTEFTRDEMQKLSELLHLSDSEFLSIFFVKSVI